jgi:hypothetical protein
MGTGRPQEIDLECGSLLPLCNQSFTVSRSGFTVKTGNWEP